MSAEPVPDPRRARVRVGAGAALILVLVGLGVAVFLTAITPHGATSVVSPGDAGDGGANPSDDPVAASSGGDAASIYVHILGQVARPGLYELRDGDRAVDVVAAAGGFTDTADPAGLNLARFLTDGEQIVVPAVGEVPVGAPGVTADGKVNLNSADQAALETLPRVGPAMAQRILDWREANGPFTAVEDLLNVTGIGDKTLEGLRDLVTV
jgi:competence protein ComEA